MCVSNLLGLQTEANWRVFVPAFYVTCVERNQLKDPALLHFVNAAAGGFVGGSSQTVVQSMSSLSPALRSILLLYILLFLANTSIKIHHDTGQCYLMHRGLFLKHVEVQETAKCSDQGNTSGGRRDILSGLVMVSSILWLCGGEKKHLAVDV